MKPLKTIVAAVALGAAAAVHAMPVSGQGTWETTLFARDALGHALNWAQVQADPSAAAYFYDATLDLTWLANMNGQAPGATWWQADAWARGLADFGGGWRLPTMIDTNAPGCDAAAGSLGYYGGSDCGYNVQTQVGSAYSEWAHLFSVTLGNLPAYDTAGDVRGAPGVDFGLVNTAFFRDMASGSYWTGTELGDTAMGAFYFSTSLGFQGPAGRYGKDQRLLATAVRAGDVALAVPEPQSLALVLAALASVGFTARRRATGQRAERSARCVSSNSRPGAPACVSSVASDCRSARATSRSGVPSAITPRT